mmetsp:Transcript_13454/g.35271  ORF Transcript_13454/g.35271 Transcript_13454/m.35271 type:complete len:151 (-) Transcript_13454:923-1375(-)
MKLLPSSSSMRSRPLHLLFGMSLHHARLLPLSSFTLPICYPSQQQSLSLSHTDAPTVRRCLPFFSLFSLCCSIDDTQHQALACRLACRLMEIESVREAGVSKGVLPVVANVFINFAKNYIFGMSRFLLYLYFSLYLFNFAHSIMSRAWRK